MTYFKGTKQSVWSTHFFHSASLLLLNSSLFNIFHISLLTAITYRIIVKYSGNFITKLLIYYLAPTLCNNSAAKVHRVR